MLSNLLTIAKDVVELPRRPVQVEPVGQAAESAERVAALQAAESAAAAAAAAVTAVACKREVASLRGKRSCQVRAGEVGASKLEEGMQTIGHAVIGGLASVLHTYSLMFHLNIVLTLIVEAVVVLTYYFG